MDHTILAEKPSTLPILHNPGVIAERGKSTLPESVALQRGVGGGVPTVIVLVHAGLVTEPLIVQVGENVQPAL